MDVQAFTPTVVYLAGRPLFNGGMDSADIRRQNARRLVDEFDGGQFARAADRLGKSPAQISHVIGTNPVKNIGPRLARQWETAYNRPHGWLDQIHEAKDAALHDEILEDGPDIGTMRRAPMVGTAQLGLDGFWEEMDYPTGHGDGWVEVPTRDPNAYSLRVRGNSMAPAIKDGWIVVVYPGHQIIPGEYVLLKLTDGRKTVKTFLYDRGETIGVLSVNGDESHQFWRDQIEDMQYVGPIFPPSTLRTD